MRLPSVMQKIGLAVLAAALLSGTGALAQAQQGPPAPKLSAEKTSAPKPPGMPASLPSLAPESPVVPAVPSLGTPSGKDRTPAAAEPAEVSIKDIVVGATDGQTPSNPTGR